MRYLVSVKREIMSWLNPEAFGDVICEFSSREAAQDYINKKPKFIQKKIHIVER